MCNNDSSFILTTNPISLPPVECGTDDNQCVLTNWLPSWGKGHKSNHTAQKISVEILHRAEFQDSEVMQFTSNEYGLSSSTVEHYNHKRETCMHNWVRFWGWWGIAFCSYILWCTTLINITLYSKNWHVAIMKNALMCSAITSVRYGLISCTCWPYISIGTRHTVCDNKRYCQKCNLSQRMISIWLPNDPKLSIAND